MAGFCHYFFTMKAQEYISTMFINVCYNFTPFLSQVTSYLIGAQDPFPGTFTALGGAALFVGCTLLSMTYEDQQDLAHIPTVGNPDADIDPKALGDIRLAPESQ